MSRIPETRAVQRVRDALSYGKSAIQISQELGGAEEGYSPEWVDKVIVDLYGDFNSYDAHIQLAVILKDTLEIAATAKDHFINSSKPDPRMADQATKALVAAAERVENALERSRDSIERLDSEQVGMLVQLVQSVTLKTLDWVFDKYPDVAKDRDEIEEEMTKAIAIAAAPVSSGDDV